MSNVYLYNDNKIKIEDSAFILGSFEAIHKGHLKLINKAISENEKVTILIFKNPEELPKNNNLLFMDLNSRIQILANLKIDNILVVNFDEKIKNMSGIDFLNSLKLMGAQKFYIGKDFKAGKNGELNSEKIKLNFNETVVVDLLENNNVKISTSILKENLVFGNFSFINENLVANFLIKIRINFKNQIFFLEKFHNLPPGLYIVKLIYNNKKYHGFIHINFDKNIKTQLHLFNQDFSIADIENCFLEIIKEHRFIISESTNVVNNQEKSEIKKFFLK
ncbi:FAD synthase [Mesomycoplasma lagogenitalium]|uniref:FAD synthase n=1 Tax=Mesomycoplasma lagogenitalium TaxID=171286 RepID=A0ABY8LSY8_9BACT|nr:adenylyltransferase/cytidyltransferase family protein [Mesomycoplasma lagogenitalium]WGI36367.1 pantoate--beta-alanine ligase [Mesomycoplasma lagogenitalium]